MPPDVTGYGRQLEKHRKREITQRRQYFSARVATEPQRSSVTPLPRNPRLSASADQPTEDQTLGVSRVCTRPPDVF